MFDWRLILLGGVLLISAVPAMACELALEVSQLPGESQQEARERFREAHAEYWAVQSYHRERSAFEQASAVYVGRILSKIDPDYKANVMPAVTVQPVEAVKGPLPAQSRFLGITALNSCGNNAGDGDAALGKVDTLVVVFEGLPVSKERPNGIDSFRATDIRTFELLDPLYKHGKEIPEEVLLGMAPPKEQHSQ